MSAKSPGAEPLYDVLTKINAAKTLWDLLAVRISEGYLLAYKEHTRVLDEANEIKKELEEADWKHYYFVLSLIAVSVAGGFAGGILAPWVAKAGQNMVGGLRKAISFGVRGGGISAVSEGAEIYAQHAVDKLTPDTSGTTPYVPNTKEPLQFHLEISDAVDTPIAELTDFITNEKFQDGLIEVANQENWSRERGEVVAQALRRWPILTEVPDFATEIPSKEAVAREAELAMWMAWGSSLDRVYWADLYANIEDSTYRQDGSRGFLGAEEREAMTALDPILDHLVRPKFGNPPVNIGSVIYIYAGVDGSEPFLDLRNLRLLGRGESDVLDNFSQVATPAYVGNPTSRMDFLTKMKKLRK